MNKIFRRFSEETFDREKYGSKNPLLKFFLNGFFSELKGMVELSGADSILEAGCGEGRLIRELLDWRPGLKVEGFDVKPDLLCAAKRLNPQAKLSIQDIYDLPYESNSMDLVLCVEVLEHLEFPDRALDEIERICKRCAIFSVPHEPFFRMSNFLRGKYIGTLGNKPNHLHTWGRADFRRLLMNRFEVIKIKTPFPWLVALCEKNR